MWPRGGVRRATVMVLVGDGPGVGARHGCAVAEVATGDEGAGAGAS